MAGTSHLAKKASYGRPSAPVRKSTAPKPEKNKSLEQWIWDAAYSICGAKDFILPLIFTKRLIKCEIAAKEWGHSCPHKNGKSSDKSVATPLKLYGQEYVAETWAMANMNRHGLAQQHLNVAAVKRTLVPVPSLKEQDEIEHSLATVQRKLANASSKKASLELLFRALLHELMTANTRVRQISFNSDL